MWIYGGERDVVGGGGGGGGGREESRAGKKRVGVREAWEVAVELVGLFMFVFMLIIPMGVGVGISRVDAWGGCRAVSIAEGGLVGV